VIARPVLLVPVGLVTVNLENVSFSDVNVTRLLAPLMLVVVLAELIRGGARVRLGPPFWCVGGYVVWAVASGLWTESVEGTRFLLQSLAIAVIFMLACASLLNSERDLRGFLYVFAVTASLLGGLSVIAFAGNLEIPHLEVLQEGRSQGGVGDPDFFAAIQLVAIPLVLVLAGEAKSRGISLALYLGLLTILASVFTSLSRGAFLAAAVLAVLLLVSRPERFFRTRQEKVAALVVIALGMTFFLSSPNVREQVVSRAESVYAPKTRQDETGSGRTVIWAAAKRTAAEHPILGVGFGSFIYISEELIFDTPNISLDVYQLRGDETNFVAHNTYLGTAAELGLVGLALYLSVLFSTAFYLRRTTRRAFEAGKPFVGRVANALVLGLASWAVTSIFLSGETARIFWIIIGLSLALPKLIPERQPAPEIGSRP
jgi:putative inorganic carbon (hco3(-)) transporter